MQRIANLVARMLMKLAGLLSCPAKLLGTGYHSLRQKPCRGFTEDRERVGDDMYRSLGSSTTGKKL